MRRLDWAAGLTDGWVTLCKLGVTGDDRPECGANRTDGTPCPNRAAYVDPCGVGWCGVHIQWSPYAGSFPRGAK